MSEGAVGQVSRERVVGQRGDGWSGAEETVGAAVPRSDSLTVTLMRRVQQHHPLPPGRAAGPPEWARRAHQGRCTHSFSRPSQKVSS